MIQALQRWSEPYPASGMAAGKGILNSLGRPPLELLELLVREAIQNSWDAASRPSVVPVTVRIRAERLKDEQLQAIRGSMLSDVPEVVGLESALQESPEMLVISDRGTHGLQGTTRADLPTDGPRDFVAFLRNIGEPPDKPMGGGSFGFGKAALYLVSLAHTIVVHSRAQNESGDLETRLIAVGLSDEYTEEVDGQELRMTGRHFWGLANRKLGLAEPLLNGDCDAYVEMLGLDPFTEAETGTDIVILCPNLCLGDSRDDENCRRKGMELVSRSVAWHFWPKLYGPKQSMEISVSLDGDQIPIPSPADEPRLAAFQSALFDLEGIESPTVPLRSESFEIRSKKPKRFLGNLNIETHPIALGNKPYGSLSAPEGGMPLRHIALMRNAELVVKYLEGPEIPASNLGYCGVFKVSPGDEELDQIFRASEPPSHDDWVAQALEDRSSRVFVNVALREIDRCANDYVGAGNPQPGADEDVPLGGISRQLAELIPSSDGSGAGIAPGGSSSVLSGSAKPLFVKTPVHLVTGGRRGVFEAEIEARQDVFVKAKASVAVMDGAKPESQTPEGAPLPEVIGWRTSDGTEVSGDVLKAKRGETWTVSVRSSADVMVVMEFEVTE